MTKIADIDVALDDFEGSSSKSLSKVVEVAEKRVEVLHGAQSKAPLLAATKDAVRDAVLVLIKSLCRLGAWQFRNGKFIASKSTFMRAQSLGSIDHPAEHETSFRYLYSIARWEGSDKASAILANAIAYLEKLYTPSDEADPDKSRLAHWYKLRGRQLLLLQSTVNEAGGVEVGSEGMQFKAAERSLLKAREILRDESAASESDAVKKRDYALALSELASVHFMKRQYGQSLFLHELAASILENALGEDSLFLAMERNLVAVSMVGKGDFTTAAPLCNASAGALAGASDFGFMSHYGLALRTIASCSAYSFFKMGNFEQVQNMTMKKTIFALLCQATQIEIESMQAARLFASVAEISHTVRRLLREAHIMSSFIMKAQPFPDANRARESTFLLHLQLKKLVDDERFVPVGANVKSTYAWDRPSSLEEEQKVSSHSRCATFREAFRRGAAALDAREFNDENESGIEEGKRVDRALRIPAFETSLEDFAAALPKGTVVLHFVEFEKDALGLRKTTIDPKRKSRREKKGSRRVESAVDEQNGTTGEDEKAADKEDKKGRETVASMQEGAIEEGNRKTETSSTRNEAVRDKVDPLNYGVYVMAQDLPHDIYLLDLGPKHEIDHNIAKYRALLTRVSTRRS